MIHQHFNEANYRQTNSFYGISDAKIASIRKKLHYYHKLYFEERPIFIEGLGKVVGADETILFRRGTIIYSTSTNDEIRIRSGFLEQLILMIKLTFI